MLGHTIIQSKYCEISKYQQKNRLWLDPTPYKSTILVHLLNNLSHYQSNEFYVKNVKCRIHFSMKYLLESHENLLHVQVKSKSAPTENVGNSNAYY